jgi:hypothetical protein
MRYRSDISKSQPDGAILWYAQWMGGPTLSKIENCRLANLQGDMRRTVTITGEADTWFSIPAECSIAGCKVKGYVTSESDTGENLIFRQVYY